MTRTNGAPTPISSLLRAMVAIFLLALCARGVFLAVRGMTVAPDTADYTRLAENLRAHGAFSLEAGPEFTPSIRRAPLYAIFLSAFVHSGTVSLKAVTVAQIIIDAGIAVLIFLLASTSISLRWALAAGIAYALNPAAVYFSTAIISELLFTALSIIGVSMLLYGLRSDRVVVTALAGVAFGLASLCRPIALPLPFLLIAVWWFIERRRPRRWLHSLLVVLCAGLVLAPWLIRCGRVSGHFVFVQGATPVLFYVATRTDWDQKDQERLWPRFGTEDPYGRRLMAARTPAEVIEADRYGLSLALENVKNNPRGYLASRFAHFPYLFITSFDMFTGVNKSFGQLVRERNVSKLALKAGLLLAISLLPFLLACAGVVLSRNDLTVMLCATVWIYTFVISFPGWIEYRYGFPAVPFLLVSAACGAQRINHWAAARKNAPA